MQRVDGEPQMTYVCALLLAPDVKEAVLEYIPRAHAKHNEANDIVTHGGFTQVQAIRRLKTLLLHV